jgi:hypothetical protein
MFKHKYKRFNADNFKKQCTPNDFYSKTERRKKQMARGGNEMRRKSEASDEIWKRGYN